MRPITFYLSNMVFNLRVNSLNLLCFNYNNYSKKIKGFFLLMAAMVNAFDIRIQQ